MGLGIVKVLLSTTNKIHRYTIFFIVVSALYVSSGFSGHHQELKNCTCSIGYLSSLFAATANVGESFRTVFELLMMSGKTARNMYSTENNKEYRCILLVVLKNTFGVLNNGHTGVPC